MRQTVDNWAATVARPSLASAPACSYKRTLLKYCVPCFTHMLCCDLQALLRCKLSTKRRMIAEGGGVLAGEEAFLKAMDAQVTATEVITCRIGKIHNTTAAVTYYDVLV